ncbi:MAG: hypothetical protein SA339_13920 [Methanomassiliicoccus sp.]|nr:hypothetical protein [Methanomassiliicoccus sp.]
MDEPKVKRGVRARIDGMRTRVSSYGPGRKVLVLVAIALLVFTPVLVLEKTIITNGVGSDNTAPDLWIYRARTDTIIHGGLLYTDVRTETPPLICYIMVPAQLLGGAYDDLVYRAYFMLFGLLGGILLYIGLRKYGEKAAFAMAAMYVVMPFGLIEAANAEDETIVALTIIIPALLMLGHRNNWVSVATGLGIWTKMWAILLLPVQLIHLGTWKERFLHLGIIAAITVAVAGPFYYLCGDDFLWFIRYYTIGVQGRTAEGAGIFYFLKAGGLEVPKQIELAIVAVAICAAIWIMYRRKLGVWESITIMLVAFFVTYPKMHTGYWLMPITFLLAWGAEDMRIAGRCFLLYIPWMIAVGFAPGGSGSAVFTFDGSWMLGLVFALITSAMMIETTYQAMKRRPFVSREKEPGDGRTGNERQGVVRKGKEVRT